MQVLEQTTSPAISMLGTGLYDANCQPQASGVEAAELLLRGAAQAVGQNRDHHPVTIVDDRGR